MLHEWKVARFVRNALHLHFFIAEIPDENYDEKNYVQIAREPLTQKKRPKLKIQVDQIKSNDIRMTGVELGSRVYELNI